MTNPQNPTQPCSSPTPPTSSRKHHFWNSFHMPLRNLPTRCKYPHNAMNDATDSASGSLSRRCFLKTFGTSAAAAATSQVEAVAAELEKANKEKVVGPEAVPVTLQVNGKPLKLQLEPRVTLLEALRNHSNLTGAKEVCDRGTCGACTVLMDDIPVYSCSKLAIDAQGHAITTIEGLAPKGKLTKVQQAFIDQD